MYKIDESLYLARAVFLMLLLCFLAAAISLENHNQQICSLISLYYEFVFGCICLSVFVFDHLRESPKSWPDNDSPSERSPIVPGRERFQSQPFSQLLLRHFYPLLYFCLPIFQEKTLSRVFFLLKARVLSHNFNVTVSKCQEDRLAICICAVCCGHWKYSETQIEMLSISADMRCVLVLKFHLCLAARSAAHTEYLEPRTPR